MSVRFVSENILSIFSKFFFRGSVAQRRWFFFKLKNLRYIPVGMSRKAVAFDGGTGCSAVTDVSSKTFCGVQSSSRRGDVQQPLAVVECVGSSVWAEDLSVAAKHGDCVAEKRVRFAEPEAVCREAVRPDGRGADDGTVFWNGQMWHTSMRELSPMGVFLRRRKESTGGGPVLS